MTGPQAHAQNLDTIVRAGKADQLMLMEVRVHGTDEVRTALCAASFDGAEYTMTPFALMIDGNPFELLDPPNPEGGFYTDD